MGKERVRMWKRRKGVRELLQGPAAVRKNHRLDFNPKFRFNRENDPQLNEIDVSGEIALKC